MRKLLAILIILITSVSCVKRNSEDLSEIVTIQISEKIIDNKKDYSNNIEITEIIKLETNEQSILGNIRKVEFCNHRFYISDDNHQLFIFDSVGKFLFKLSRGKGPKEYFELRDFSVDENDVVTILSYKTLVFYDSIGKFIDKRKFDVTSQTGREINPVKFSHVSDKFYLYMGSFGLKHIEPEKEKSIYCLDANNEIIEEYFPITSELTGHQTFYRSNNATYLSMSYGNDTIYEINESGIYPKIAVDFLDKKITEKDMMGDRASLYDRRLENNLKGLVKNIFENDEYLCFSFSSGKKKKLAVQNKITEELNIYNMADKTLPGPLFLIDGVINEDFFFLINPYLLLNWNKDGFYENLFKKDSLYNLKIDDNPVIFKIKFKQ